MERRNLLIYQIFFRVLLEKEMLERAAEKLEGWRKDFFLRAFANAIELSHLLTYLSQNPYVYLYLQTEKEKIITILKDEIKIRLDYVLERIEIPPKKRKSLFKAIEKTPMEISLVLMPFSYN